jgi:multidrug resistance efflux pump
VDKSIASVALARARAIAPAEGGRRSALLRPARAAPLVAVLLAAIGYGAWRRGQVSHPREWFGTIEADQMHVGSRAGGRVGKVFVGEGDRVVADQVIVELEGPDLEGQLLTARGQVEEAEAVLSKLHAGARPEEAAQAEARAQAAAAAFRASRVRALLGSGAMTAFSGLSASALRAEPAGADRGAAASTVASDQEARAQLAADLLSASRQADLAEAQAHIAESSAAERLIRAGTREEDVRAAEGRALAAQGAFNRAAALVAELRIHAPRAARVEAMLVRPGDLLAPSAPAATLVEDDQLFARVYVPETQLGYVHEGDRVWLAVDSFPGRDFAGRIESVSTSGEYLARNIQTVDDRANQVFATRVRILAPIGDLRAGMAAAVRVAR